MANAGLEKDLGNSAELIPGRLYHFSTRQRLPKDTSPPSRPGRHFFSIDAELIYEVSTPRHRITAFASTTQPRGTTFSAGEPGLPDPGDQVID